LQQETGLSVILTVTHILEKDCAQGNRIVLNIYLLKMENDKNKYQSRRDFVKTAGKIVVASPLLLIPVMLVRKTNVKGYVWQIDPYKCTQCGQCKTNCVLTPSASKCTHAFKMCGYCDLCGGFLRQGVKTISTGAENQLCPTGAIKRRFIEEPYFEYTIDEKLCDGCAKCVKGCGDFGNGSLYMQIRHNLCVNCNECSIARTCPSNAVIRVPADQPYIRKT
jgi:Na+-translocating ferredoxin:NAD+ oxidoreductase subunit B